MSNQEIKVTKAIFANWVQKAPAFFTDSAMQGLTCGAALYFAHSARLYSFLPRLIMMTTPATLALTVAGAALLKHTIYFIAANQTQGQTETKVRHPQGGFTSPRHTLGPINGNLPKAAAQVKNQLVERALLIGEMALISLTLGGGISIPGIVSIYFAKVLAERLSSFFFFDTFHRQANEQMQGSWVQDQADALARQIQTHRSWGRGHRLG